MFKSDELGAALRIGHPITFTLTHAGCDLHSAAGLHRFEASYLHELVDGNHIVPLPRKNGRRSVYVLAALTDANGFIASSDSDVQPMQGPATTDANDFIGTDANGFIYPRIDKSLSRKYEEGRASLRSAALERYEEIPQDPDDLRELAILFAARFANTPIEKAGGRNLKAYVGFLARMRSKRHSLADVWDACEQLWRALNGAPLFAGEIYNAQEFLPARLTHREAGKRAADNYLRAQGLLSDDDVQTESANRSSESHFSKIVEPNKEAVL